MTKALVIRDDIFIGFIDFMLKIDAKTADEALSELLNHADIEVIRECRSDKWEA